MAVILINRHWKIRSAIIQPVYLLALILLFGISSSCSLEKRIYRNGYYLNIINGVSAKDYSQNSISGDTNYCVADKEIVLPSVPTIENDTTLISGTCVQDNRDSNSIFILDSVAADSVRHRNTRCRDWENPQDDVPHESREWIWPLAVTEILILTFFQEELELSDRLLINK